MGWLKLKLKTKISFDVDVEKLYEKSKEMGLEWNYLDCEEWIKENFDEIVEKHCKDILEASPWSENNRDKPVPEKIEGELMERIKRKYEMREMMSKPKKRIK